MPATQRADQKGQAAIDPMKALRGFFHIMDAWGVSADDARVLLGSPAERTYYAWRQGNAVRVPMDSATSQGSTRSSTRATAMIRSIGVGKTPSAPASRSARSASLRTRANWPGVKLELSGRCISHLRFERI